jgi:hypothetical protein
MAYKVFLSVGSPFNDTQEVFISSIEQYLRDNDLIPQTVGRTVFTATQPLKAVNELMKECYGSIILALERTQLIEGIERRDSPKQTKLSDAKLTTPWNQIEAAMAYSHDHPLLVIAETGIKGEGLLERGYDWYVLEVDSSSPPVNDPMFQAIIADWKKRVIQFSERNKSVSSVSEASTEPTVAAPPEIGLGGIDIGLLRRNMQKALDDEELADLCFDMHIGYEDLKGTNRSARIRELILLCERSGRIGDLLAHCRLMRPNLEWQKG